MTNKKPNFSKSKKASTYRRTPHTKCAVQRRRIKERISHLSEECSALQTLWREIDDACHQILAIQTELSRRVAVIANHLGLPLCDPFPDGGRDALPNSGLPPRAANSAPRPPSGPDERENPEASQTATPQASLDRWLHETAASVPLCKKEGDS